MTPSGERLQAEKDNLTKHLRLLLGFNDRVRRVGDEAEKLRLKVTMSIRRALDVLTAELPALAAHFRAVDCGRVMVYRPGTPIPWSFASP